MFNSDSNKTRTQSNNPFLCVHFVLTSSLIFLTGLGGVYKGLTATVIKQGTNQMIRFFVYTNLKSYLQGGDPSKDIGSIRTFIIGGIAGAASVFGNTPVDVVKTRMQVCNSFTLSLPASNYYGDR